MFSRFFRRGKKKETPVKKEDSTVTESSQALTETESNDDETDTQSLEEFSIPETPFEEKFSGLPRIISETITEEIEPSEPFEQVIPFIKPVLENEISITDFISPEYLVSPLIELDQITPEVTIVSVPKVEYPPITLEEKIEGALYSVGRPVHVTELIENLEEESPKVKRALRKLQRRRKRSSSIVVEEISKDRWVLQLNPIYNDLFSSFMPGRFMEPDERRVLTEICYRQPISIAMVKKLIQGIGPVKITELCKQLEARGYIVGEKKARSFVYTSTPKFAQDFGFDDESRRLKLQMLWRLKRLMGDYEVEEEEEEQIEEEVEEGQIEEEEILEEKVEEGQIEEEEILEEEVEEGQIEEEEILEEKVEEGQIEEEEILEEKVVEEPIEEERIEDIEESQETEGHEKSVDKDQIEEPNEETRIETTEDRIVEEQDNGEDDSTSKAEQSENHETQDNESQSE